MSCQEIQGVLKNKQGAKSLLIYRLKEKYQALGLDELEKVIKNKHLAKEILQNNPHLVIPKRALREELFKHMPECSPCARIFYAETYKCLHEFVAPPYKGVKSLEEGTRDFVMPWALSSIGFSYSQIVVKLSISKSMVSRRVFEVREFLADVNELFGL